MADVQSKRHRKRLIPPGPAGLWFQVQQSSSDTTGINRIPHGAGSKNGKNQEAQPEEEEDDDETSKGESALEYHQHSILSSLSSSTSLKQANYSPAWTAAHVELGFVTPAIPTNNSVNNNDDPFQILRPFVPPEYALLRDIIKDTDAGGWKNHPLRLLLQILAIQTMTANDHLWTIILSDETMTDTITAWIQPSLVRLEQKDNRQLRPGNILLLQHCSFHFIQHQERLMLISKENILRCFTTTDSEQLPHATYITWMETRNQLTLQVRAEQQHHDGVDEAQLDHGEEDEEATQTDDQRLPETTNDADSGLTQPTQHQHQPSKDIIAVKRQKTNESLQSLTGATQSPGKQCSDPIIVRKEPQRRSSPKDPQRHHHVTPFGSQQHPTPLGHQSPSQKISFPEQPPAPVTQPTIPLHLQTKQHQSCQNQQHQTTAATQISSPIISNGQHQQTTTRRKRSIFPHGCPKLMTDAAWEEMKQFIPTVVKDDPEPLLPPVFSNKFCNLCPTLFRPNAFDASDVFVDR